MSDTRTYEYMNEVVTPSLPHPVNIPPGLHEHPISITVFNFCREGIPQSGVEFTALTYDQLFQCFPYAPLEPLIVGFEEFYKWCQPASSTYSTYHTSSLPSSRSRSVDTETDSGSDDFYTYKNNRRWNQRPNKRKRIQNLHKDCLVKLNRHNKLVHRAKILRDFDVMEIAAKDPYWMKHICEFIDIIMIYVKFASCLEQSCNGVICHFQLQNFEDLEKVKDMFKKFNNRLGGHLKEPKWQAMRHKEFKEGGSTEQNAQQLQERWPIGKRELAILRSHNAPDNLLSRINENLRRLYAERLPVNDKCGQQGWKRVYMSIFYPKRSWNIDYFNYVKKIRERLI
eukprot:UN01979